MNNYNNDISVIQQLRDLVIDHYTAADLVEELDLTVEEILDAFGTEFRDKIRLFARLLEG
jgi:hypothetical protein